MMDNSDRDGSSPLDSLEREVLERLVEGQNVAEVAADLGMDSHAIQAVMRNVMHALDAQTWLQAVLAALRLGLIELPDPDE